MRIDKEIKMTGYFWLPETPDDKLPGTLSIKNGGNIDLEIVGVFGADNSYDPKKFDLGRLNGHVETLGPLTLEGCFYTKKASPFGGISKSLVCVNKCYAGVAYNTNDNITFSSVDFCVEGLNEWCGISGFTDHFDRANHKFELTYVPPKEITIPLNNGMVLFIKFLWTQPNMPMLTEVKISQKTYFRLLSEDERPFEDFISIIYKITNFLCFAIDKTVCVEWVTARSERFYEEFPKGNKTAIPISIYYGSLPFILVKPEINWGRMLFRYNDISSDVVGVINKWIDAYGQTSPAFDHYFSIISETHKVNESKFLTLVQGLETFHRRTSDEKIMDQRVFNVLTEKIIFNCPEGLKGWLAGRLTHGNEINLRQRIKRIVEPFKDYFGNSKERSKLVGNIVDTRNYYTHYDVSLRGQAAERRELWVLSLKMEALFQLHFLQVLGFSDEKIHSIVGNCYPLKQKLKDEG